MSGPTPNPTPNVGDANPPREFGPLTRTDFVKYQGASGDFHPLHHDDTFAHAAGFPSVFSVGMLQAGLLATYATDWLGAENIRRYTLRFEEQCWPDDLLTCTGTVTGVDPGRGLVTVELRCTRQTGGVAISATADFAMV
ncbi:MAG: MaoC/PaaZ C-terminal domain-containing protein [Acidimicrobiales bacterium]